MANYKKTGSSHFLSPNGQGLDQVADTFSRVWLPNEKR